MGRYLDAAYIVLKSEKRPLSARDITELALNEGVLLSKGLTPWQTMKSKLSTDILNKKNKSLFVRTNKGEFALREWLKEENYEEYIADRFTKALLDEYAVVFPKSSLPNYISQPGLHLVELKNSRSLINECSPMLRRDAEENFDVIQLVSVFMLSLGNKYLTYKRTKRLPERRLHGYYSMIFGGHLTPTDLMPLFNIFIPSIGAEFLTRELSEEVIFPKDHFPKITYKGLLYDKSREVSSQHLGIVFDVLLSTDKFIIGERGFLMDHRFETVDEILARESDFENWSVLIANYEKQKKDNRS